ncbi:MAG: ribose 5-phosphate isomerase B [Candidatus Aminicenantes bacterium]|jgi:ribose 5-phosphate isomerase B|nr:ribose 5-phosphate isomerase B [Candidatus Aminicenantes bacterium]MDH5383134.1 ribose 5-phosphate isomerase B [Candidatus Aminicenantes bacterium]MDH5742451.1 ribose 5-phosphate isomerase B [Candidatus Aminicenantes bacterium]
MRIALASDHAGFDLKKGVLDHLTENGIECEDFGCGPGERVDYVDYGERAIRSVLSGECDRAVLFCGTGLGMAIVANKHRGIRATPCWDEYVAEVSRSHNDSNCLTLGGRVIPMDEALHFVDIWLRTDYEGGRHQCRLDKISKIEEKNFKPQDEE